MELCLRSDTIKKKYKKQSTETAVEKGTGNLARTIKKTRPKVKNTTKIQKTKPTKPNKKPTKKEEQLRTKKGKEIMLKELISSYGNITTACIKTNINRATYYDWIEKDNKFKQAVDDIPEITLDHYEKRLHELIDGGNVIATLFALKSKGKKRGWEETQKHETKIDVNLTKIDIKFEIPQEFKNITPKSYLPDDVIEVPKKN